MRAAKHLFGLNIMTADAFFGHLRGSGFPGKLDQFVVLRNILCVTFGAAYRTPVPFLVTVHALPVEGPLESDSPGHLRIE